MALLEHRPVPPIDPLKVEVLSLLKLHKLGTDKELVDDDNLSKSAWAIRKLCGFVKSKVRRSEVSTATRLQVVCRIIASIFSAICEQNKCMIRYICTRAPNSASSWRS